MFKAGLFQPTDVRCIGKLRQKVCSSCSLSGEKRGCAGVRTNNKTGVGHFSRSVFIPVILQVACALAALSFTPVTYLCKLTEIHFAAFLQLELFRIYQKINLIL